MQKTVGLRGLGRRPGPGRRRRWDRGQSVPQRADCHPRRKWAVLQPQTEMRSGGCSLGRIWDLLWVGALLNAHALWAGLGCQNHEPGWAESWETPASSLGPKQGLRKSLRGLHPVASKHEKPLLNMYAYVHTQVYMYVHRHACAHVYLHAQACVRLCTHTCICVHRCVCMPVHACMCSPSQTPRGSGRGTHGPEHPAQKHHPEQTGLLAPAQGSSHEPGMRTLNCTACCSLPTR